LRYGAGLKGKMLDSLAAGVPCAMSTIAAEGLDLPEDLQVLIADDPDILARRVAVLCRDDREYRRIATAGQAYVAERYGAARIDALLRDACGTPGPMSGRPAADAPGVAPSRRRGLRPETRPATTTEMTAGDGE
jgi:hypothetical protein